VPHRLGKTIRILREAKGLTLAEVVRQAKISKPFLSLIENGHRDPSLAVIRRIASVLDVPAEALVLMGMKSSSSLESSDLLTNQIMKSVEKMMSMENQLRQLLGSEEDDSIHNHHTKWYCESDELGDLEAVAGGKKPWVLFSPFQKTAPW
jgi:transcriptional regulator with XRE-family HTH domain